jgi:metallo-beta-lactamase family protein
MDKKTKLKNKDIEISFKDSYSTEDVTGSCVLVKIPNYDMESKNKEIQCLLDCGLYQGGSLKQCYSKNSRNFSFKVKKIDFVLISHAHIDHIGRLPLFVKRGGNVPIYVPKGNIEIIEKLLYNSAMIMKGEAENLTNSSKNGKVFSPIFTKEDVKNTLQYVQEIDFDKETFVKDFIKFKFIKAGHIINSGSIILSIFKNRNSWKDIYYTGDIGNTKFYKDNYYVDEMDIVQNADVVIAEHTYNNPKTCIKDKQRDLDMTRLHDTIKHHCVQEKGSILIPVFSLHRSQAMLTLLYDMYSEKNLDIPIYLDGVLMNDMNKIMSKQYSKFNNVLNWKNVKRVKNMNDRNSLMKDGRSKIVLATSGFLQSSSMVWLKSMIQDRKNCIIFCGYSGDKSSVGYKLKLKSQNTIKLNRQVYKNNIRVTKLKSFSSHMQYDDMLEYYSDIKSEKLILHHGNKEGSVNFKNKLEDKLEEKLNNSKVIISNKSLVVKL